MSGTLWRFVVTATEDISSYLTGLDIPLDDETVDPNVAELADLDWLADHDLIGEALIVSYEYVGSYVAVDIVVFASIRELLVRWSQEDSEAEALL
jgi:hypothetical protein